MCQAQTLGMFKPNDLKSFVSRFRYEDLCTWPNRTIERLFNFYNLTVSNSVVTFLKHHTYASPLLLDSEIIERHNIYTNKWITQLETNQVLHIQNVCQNAMKYFGYRSLPNETYKNIFFDSTLEILS